MKNNFKKILVHYFTTVEVTSSNLRPFSFTTAIRPDDIVFVMVLSDILSDPRVAHLIDNIWEGNQLFKRPSLASTNNTNLYNRMDFLRYKYLM